MTMTEPNYRVLKFGNHPTEGLWNSRSFTRSLVEAENLFHEAEIERATGGDFIGSVLIKVDDDSWHVLDKFGTEGYSIGLSQVGVFEVSNSDTVMDLS